MQGTAGVRWFHWLLVCGVVVFILGIGLVFVCQARFDLGVLRMVYGAWGLLLLGLLVALLTIATRWGVAAAAQHSVWVFMLAATVLVLWGMGLIRSSGDYGEGCRRNLKMVGLAVLMYASDNDDKLPPANCWQEAVRLGIDQMSAPRLSAHEILQCPLTKKPYIFNDHVAGKALADVVPNLRASISPTRLRDRVIAREALMRGGRGPHPLPQGLRGLYVLFCDGHVLHLPTEGL